MARQSKIQFYMSLGRGRGGEIQTPAYTCFMIILVSFIVGLLTYVVWDQTIPKQPTFSIEQFYVPALDKTAATDHHVTLNTTITFDLQIKNPDDAVYYDAFDVTLYYGHNFSTPIGNISMPGFRQGRKKTAHRIETLDISDGVVPWEIAMEEVLKGFAPFSIGLSTAVKYTKFSRYSGRTELNLGADLNVNYYGIAAGMNGIKLSSSNSVHKSLSQGPNEESNVGLAAIA